MRVLMLSAALTLAIAGPVAAQEEKAKADETKPTFDIKPVVLDSDETDGATVGIEYDTKGTLWSRKLSQSDGGDDDLDTTVAVGKAQVNYKAKGVIAASADRNPKDFLDGQLSFDGSYFTATSGGFKAGGFVRLESDQSFDETQVVYGGRVTWGKYDFPARNAFLALDLNYGQVDPGDDKNRKTTLGVTKLDSYDRWDFEALYIHQTGWSVAPTIELNYRYYYEPDAPAAIKAANLHKHHLASVRVGLKGDFFVGYSEGKLPFDRKKDHSLEIGLSYKLY